MDLAQAAPRIPREEGEKDRGMTDHYIDRKERGEALLRRMFDSNLCRTTPCLWPKRKVTRDVRVRGDSMVLSG
jgi:hypothetical protein